MAGEAVGLEPIQVSQVVDGEPVASRPAGPVPLCPAGIGFSDRCCRSFPCRRIGISADHPLPGLA